VRFEILYWPTAKDRTCQNPCCAHRIRAGEEYGSATLIGGIHPATRYSFCVRCGEMLELACDDSGDTPLKDFDSLLNEAYARERKQEEMAVQ
jgi:hypothetical protein